MAALQRIDGHMSLQITAHSSHCVSPGTHADTLRALEALEPLDSTPSGCAEVASKMRVESEREEEIAVNI